MSQDNTTSDLFKIRDRYIQMFVLALVFMAIFELVNGILNVVLLRADAQNADTRSTTTRQVIIAAAYCVRIPENNTELEIRKCVSNLIDQPITSDTQR